MSSEKNTSQNHRSRKPSPSVGWTVYRFLRRLQRYKLYRSLARKAFRKQVRYRVAVLGDASQLAWFYSREGIYKQENIVEEFARNIKNLKDRGFVLTAGLFGMIVGAAALIYFPENSSLHSGWWIFSLLVDKHYRGLGIGEGIVREILKRASTLGAERVNLMVNDQNERAINLYRKIGFQRISIPKLDSVLEKDAQQGKPRQIPMSIGLKHPSGFRSGVYRL